MNKPKRHKCNIKVDKCGVIGSCLNCGMVKEIISGRMTYFLDDNIKFTAGDCDHRLINHQQLSAHALIE